MLSSLLLKTKKQILFLSVFRAVHLTRDLIDC